MVLCTIFSITHAEIVLTLILICMQMLALIDRNYGLYCLVLFVRCFQHAIKSRRNFNVSVSEVISIRNLRLKIRPKGRGYYSMIQDQSGIVFAVF